MGTLIRAMVSSGLAIAAGCASGPTSSAAPTAHAGPEAPSAAGSSTRETMRDHFADATAARDAVIAGRLEAVRAPLMRLASAQPGRDMPSDWVPWFDEVRAVAARGAQAGSLASAAQSVVELAANCGECHRSTRGGPKEALSPEYHSAGEKGLAEKMARHRFAADELWMGLTGPMHQAWSSGAAALMNITVPGLVTERGYPATEDRRPSGGGTLQGAPDPELPAQEPADGTADRPAPAGTIDLDAALRELRALGARADAATNPADKKQILTEVITRCGACHIKVGAKI